ncbi:MAG: hypothetical protein ACPL5F_10490 [Moorellaceae bacterium]
MKKLIWICDRCKKEIDEATVYGITGYRKSEEDGLAFMTELCEECFKELRAWLRIC